MLLKTDQMACLVQEDVARVGQRCNCERNSNNNNSNSPSFVVRTIRTYVFNMKTWLPPPSWQTFFWHITRAAAVVTSGNYTHTRQANDQLLSSSSSCNIFFCTFVACRRFLSFLLGDITRHVKWWSILTARCSQKILFSLSLTGSSLSWCLFFIMIS